MGRQYADEIGRLAVGLPDVIPALESDRVRGRPPTSAYSNFAINREQGMWAETVLMKGIEDSVGSEYDVVKYGRSDSIMAGEPGFSDFYQSYQDELEEIGKRPDLLVFTAGAAGGRDISDGDPGGPGGCVERAVLGIKVRSSSYLAKKYKEIRGKAASFTPKVEDLQTVPKWIRTYGVPHYYAQVFFDEIYVISFKRILEIIVRQEDGWAVEKSQRNQFKKTVHVSVSHGRKWGEIDIPPAHKSARKEVGAGRLIHYVRFGNGRAALDGKVTASVMQEARALQ